MLLHGDPIIKGLGLSGRRGRVIRVGKCELHEKGDFMKGV